MKKSLVWVGLPVSLAAAGALAARRGRRRFRALVRRQVIRLFAGAAPEVEPDQLAARWDALPEPTRRYLRYAIPEGAPALGSVRLKHEGFLRSSRSTTKESSCASAPIGTGMPAAGGRCSRHGPASIGSTAISTAFACPRPSRWHGISRRASSAMHASG